MNPHYHIFYITDPSYMPFHAVNGLFTHIITILWSALINLCVIMLIYTVRPRQTGHLVALKNCPDYESSGLTGPEVLVILSVSREYRPDIENCKLLKSRLTRSDCTMAHVNARLLFIDFTFQLLCLFISAEIIVLLLGSYAIEDY